MNEYTIACLLQPDSAKACMRFSPQENYPHISLFQFRASNPKFLQGIIEKVSKLSLSKHFFTAGISEVEENLFLNIIDDDSLKICADELADFYREHCKEKNPLSQIDCNQLNETQTSLVQQYGIYWVKEYFHPHVTLHYNLSFLSASASHFPTANSPERTQQLPTAIDIGKPGLYFIDDKGRINCDL